MRKKLAAVVLLVALVLPYSCDTSPIRGSRAGPLTTLMFGIPVLVTIAYSLHQLWPALARFHERNGAALHGAFRALCLVLIGMYIGAALTEESSPRGRIATAASVLVAGGLLYWQQGRGTKAQRLPLLLLTVVGTAAVMVFVSFVGVGLQYGAWVFTGAWVWAVGLEVADLGTAARVSHGG